MKLRCRRALFSENLRVSARWVRCGPLKRMKLESVALKAPCPLMTESSEQEHTELHAASIPGRSASTIRKPGCVATLLKPHRAYHCGWLLLCARTYSGARSIRLLRMAALSLSRRGLQGLLVMHCCWFARRAWAIVSVEPLLHARLMRAPSPARELRWRPPLPSSLLPRRYPAGRQSDSLASHIPPSSRLVIDGGAGPLRDGEYLSKFSIRGVSFGAPTTCAPARLDLHRCRRR